MDSIKYQQIKNQQNPVHNASDKATWSHLFSMESWRLPVTRATVTVGEWMWACRMMRVKRQKLSIAQLYANKQRILWANTTKNLSAALTRHSLKCTQDRFPERSHGFKWFDCNKIKNDAWKINCWQPNVSLSHKLMVCVVNWEVQHRLMI